MNKRQVIAELKKMGIKVTAGMVNKSDIKKFLNKKAMAKDVGDNPQATGNDWDRLITTVENLEEKAKNEEFAGIEEFLDFVSQVWNGGVEQYIYNGYVKGIVMVKTLLGKINKPACNELNELIVNYNIKPSTKLPPSNDDDFVQQFYAGLDHRVVKEVLDYVVGKTIRQSTAAEESKKSLKPPKKWWDKMVEKIKENNPKYSMDLISKTIGNIWYNKLSAAKRKSIRERYGLEYGAAAVAVGPDGGSEESENPGFATTKKLLTLMLTKSKELLQLADDYKAVLDHYDIDTLTQSEEMLQKKIRKDLEAVLVFLKVTVI